MRKVPQKVINVDRVSLVFPFSEVNAAVFQNAGIFHLKKRKNFHVMVFTPEEFASCYFNADIISKIDNLPYQNYSEVSNYSLKILSRKDLKTLFGAHIFNYLLQIFQAQIPAKLFHRLPVLYKSDYKARKFLIRSNIYKEIKSKSRLQDFEFLGTANYVDLANMTHHRCNIMESMEFNFENLASMIRSGGVFKVESIKADMEIELAGRNALDAKNILFEKVKNFIQLRNSVAYVRTRNISGAASGHNTKQKDLLVLINGLLKLGYSVVNTGTPTIPVPISDRNYLEVNHNFTILEQMYLASLCSIRVMSEEAGLFVAWAAIDMPLVTFGREWSITNLKRPISLIKARQSIGIRDIQLGEDLTFSVIRNRLKL